MARTDYSDETKAAVLAALLAGQSVPEVAAQFRLPVGTVKSWKHRQDATPVALVATEKREEIGGLLVEFLAKAVRTLSLQVEHFGDKAWLQSQSAAEAAHLFGAVTDRTFRLLEALEAGAESEGGPGEDRGSEA